MTEELTQEQQEQQRLDYEQMLIDEANTVYCRVCDAVGHDGGEFGELCLSYGRSWFEPSDPRDLYDEEDRF